MNVGVMTITVEDKKLYAQITGQPKFPIFPSAEDEFFWKIVAAKIKFNRNENHEISGGTFFQNGQQLKLTKLKDEKIITINPALLDKYIGKYKLEENVVVTISKQDNKLFAKPGDEPKVEMLPVSNSDFVIPQINAKISFVADENGKVSKFKLNMNGRKSEVPRVE